MLKPEVDLYIYIYIRLWYC